MSFTQFGQGRFRSCFLCLCFLVFLSLQHTYRLSAFYSLSVFSSYFCIPFFPFRFFAPFFLSHLLSKTTQTSVTQLTLVLIYCLLTILFIGFASNIVSYLLNKPTSSQFMLGILCLQNIQESMRTCCGYNTSLTFEVKNFFSTNSVYSFSSN